MMEKEVERTMKEIKEANDWAQRQATVFPKSKDPIDLLHWYCAGVARGYMAGKAEALSPKAAPVTKET